MQKRFLIWIIVAAAIILVVVGYLVYWYLVVVPSVTREYMIGPSTTSTPIVITAEECAAKGGEIINTLEQPSYPKEQYLGDVTGMRCPCVCLKKEIDTSTDKSKFCHQDNDCTLFICSGAFNKEWAKTAPPDLPCRTYEGYTAQCINQRCTAIKPTDMSDWQTYRNEKYGFEVMIPETWEGTDIVLGISNNFSITFREKGEEIFEPPSLSIQTYDFNELEYKSWYIHSSSYFTFEKGEGIIEGIIFDIGDRKVYAVCTPYYGFSVVAVCNQILSSFRFLE